MNNTFLNRAKSLNSDFISECFKVISDCCSTQSYGHLHFNSSDYIYMDLNSEGKYVPFVHSNHKNVEMYSEDGWTDIKDIAHWTDIAIDIILAIVAGCGDKYGYEQILPKLKNHE